MDENKIVNVEKEQTITPETSEQIIYRKFDSDDVVRLRSETLKASVVDGREKITVDTGLLQKFTLVLGVKSCEWFTDVIDERVGVTPEIFIRRSQTEFRHVPVSRMDEMFKAGQKFNEAEYDVQDLKKK